MYKRPHHQRIAKVLETFDCDVLNNTKCFFGGGTAIVLLLDEYRESVDIDFLCSSNDGYRLLRNTVSNDLGSLLKSPLKHLREVRADRDAIRTVLEIDGQPIKVEFLKEGNSPVTGDINVAFGVPTLSRVDMFTQKLLANADRGMDKSSSSRDIIDLAMMVHKWGGIPRESLDKAYAAYGPCVTRGVFNSIELTQDRKYLSDCLDRMKMDVSLLDVITSALEPMQFARGQETMEFFVFENNLQISLQSAELIAKDFDKSICMDFVADKTVAAKVVGITSLHVILSLGKTAAIVAQSDLSRVPALGEDATIVFKDGKGLVADVGRLKGVDNGR